MQEKVTASRYVINFLEGWNTSNILKHHYKINIPFIKKLRAD
jgi:hypothetical protein